MNTIQMSAKVPLLKQSKHSALAYFLFLTLVSPLASFAQDTTYKKSPDPKARQAVPLTTSKPYSKPGFLQEDIYILGPGDQINLRFLTSTATSGAAGNDLLSGALDILPDGTASLPLIGSVRLTGLTLSQATLWLQALYKPQLLRPELQLNLIRPRPLRIAILGEVERPGIYTLTTTETSATQANVSITGMPTAVDAIQKAGGVTNQADLTKVNLRRLMPGNQLQYRQTNLDLLDLIRDGDLTQNPLLFDGDTIRIAKATETVPEAIELASTTLSPKEITVYMVGEVFKPGPVLVAANTPLVQAVLAAGGANANRANQKQVQLVRINRNGSIMHKDYSIDLKAGASNASNPPLRDRDAIVVGRSTYAKIADAIDAIGTPLSGAANMLSLWQILRNSNN